MLVTCVSVQLLLVQAGPWRPQCAPGCVAAGRPGFWQWHAVRVHRFPWTRGSVNAALRRRV